MVAALVTVAVGGGNAFLGWSVGEASVAETLNRDSTATGDGQIRALPGDTSPARQGHCHTPASSRR